MILKRHIYGSGTMRSGGSLHCNLISAHRDVIIIHDNLHFFRHIYKKYNPIKKKSNLFKLSAELSLRLKVRSNISIKSSKFFYALVKAKPKNYSSVHKILLNTFLQEIKNKKIIGEYSNGEFANIKTFLEFDKMNIAYQVFRDPRAMLMSWKRITFSKNLKYLHSLFNWIEAVDHAIKNKKKYGKRFLILKFEETHQNPKKVAKKICEFLKVRFDNNMINANNWRKVLNKKYNFINTSAYTKKLVYGFSKNRINTWRGKIEEWEHELVDFLCKKRMKKMGYKIDYSSYPKKGIFLMKQDNLLKKSLKRFLNYDKGTHAKHNDPSDPRNWEAGETSGKKFVQSAEYKRYMKEIRKIRKSAKKIK